jgi:D-3-phosphoglycerate dehydrogenase
LKSFLDAGDGRYVTDFPDDVLWDHKNAVVIPHLGASTEEAEDSAASMAAETIRDYLEQGTVRNSVNFPDTALPNRPPTAIRITVVNKNKPGMLALITEIFAKAELNIIQHINQSKGDIAYNVIDIDPKIEDGKSISLKQLQRDLTMTDGVLSSRLLFGTPGTFYCFTFIQSCK